MKHREILKVMKTIIVAVLLWLFFVGASRGGGKEIFISKCGSCHKSGGAAAPVNPGDKAAVVWKKYFKRKRHPDNLSKISSEDMAEIIKFLRDHAADSNQPAMAVIPK